MDSEHFARIKEIFTEALRLKPGQRDSYLDGLTDEDSRIVNDVRSLLNHHESPTQYQETTASLVSSLTTRLRLMTAGNGWAIDDQSPRSELYSWLYAMSAMTLLVVFAGAMLIHSTLREELLSSQSDGLRTICHTASTAAQQLLLHEKRLAEAGAAKHHLHQHLITCLKTSEASPSDPESWSNSSQTHSLDSRLLAVWGNKLTYQVWNRQGRLVTSNFPEGVVPGRTASANERQALEQVWQGRTFFHFVPIECRASDQGNHGQSLEIYLPICEQSGQKPEILGALLLSEPEVSRSFEKVIAVQKFRNSGESYAFDRQGRLLTSPRMFIETGLLPTGRDDAELPTSIEIDVTEMTDISSPRARYVAHLAQRAIQETSGVDMEGYADYRGETVVGAWQWLPEFQIGVAVEIDRDEVVAPLRLLDLGFLSAGSLLGLGAVVAMGIGSRRAKAPPIRERLGKYRLLEKIGEGGMGTVYKARHEWLERIVALKILKPVSATSSAIRQFSCEVRFACRLQHPNTVDIYDYGSTDDGCFYYAMEFLNGLTLNELVQVVGPLNPNRAIYLLRQICGSLCEAHEMGLVHRDIKPQNIMVCLCGGEADVIKVLDFGLVKEVAPKGSGPESTASEWVGTPRYTAPERLLQPSLADAFSDIYSLGAVAYLLLSGQEIFANSRSENLLKDIITEPIIFPETPHDLPQDLLNLVMNCLSKDCSLRPESMEELLHSLNDLQMKYEWTSVNSAEWWKTCLPQFHQPSSATGSSCRT